MFELVLVIILLSYLFVILVKFWFKTVTKKCDEKEPYWFLKKNEEPEEKD